MKWYLKALKNYADFSSRSRRKEFWMFYLFTILIMMLLSIIEFIIIDIFQNAEEFLQDSGDYTPISLGLYIILTIVPTVAVTVRRLHDMGKSGWFYLLNFIPTIGTIILLIMCMFDSEPGENKWGPNPKEEMVEDDDLQPINFETSE